MQEEATEVLIARAEKIITLLDENDDFQQVILNKCLLIYGIESKKGDWKYKESGLFCKTVSENEIIVINILLGSIKINDKEPLLIPFDYTHNNKYERAVGKQVTLLFAQQYEGYIEGRDPFGKVRLIEKKNDWGNMKLSEIHREFSDGWYQYYEISPELLPNDNSIRALNHWISLSESNPHIILCQPLTHQICYRINEDGSLNLPEKPNKSFRWKNYKTTFGGFGEAYLWQEQGETSHPEQILVVLHPFKKGSKLEFRREIVKIGKEELERWIWIDHPHLWISEKQELSGLREFNKFLIVENRFGEQRALVNKKTGYFVIEMKKGKLAPKTPLNAAFAAYCYLEPEFKVESDHLIR